MSRNERVNRWCSHTQCAMISRGNRNPLYVDDTTRSSQIPRSQQLDSALKDRYFQADVPSDEKLIREGIEGQVPYRGPRVERAAEHRQVAYQRPKT